MCNNEERMSFGEKCRECIDNKECQGDCCGCALIPKRIFEENRSKIQVPILKERDADVHGDGLCVFAETEDDKCVFLNRNSIKCMIYEERPNVCKEFGTVKDNLVMQCPFLKPNGNPRSIAQKKIYRRKVRDKMHAGIDRIKKQINYLEQ